MPKSRRSYIIIFYLFMQFHTTVAQQIYFCSDFNTNTGTPKVHSQKWKVDQFQGSFFYLVFKSPNTIPSPKMYIFIDKKGFNGHYLEFATKKIITKGNKNWVAIKYTFKDAGEYHITFTDAEKKKLASKKLTLLVKNKIALTQHVDKRNKPIKTAKAFEISEEGKIAPIFICLYENKSFQTKSIQCQVFKLVDNQYKKVVFDQTDKIHPTFSYYYFEASIKEKGKYVAVISLPNKGEIERSYFKIL